MQDNKHEPGFYPHGIASADARNIEDPRSGMPIPFVMHSPVYKASSVIANAIAPMVVNDY